MNIKETLVTISRYRTRYERELTIMNTFGITVLSLYLTIECVINSKDKYQTIQSLTNTLDMVFGERIHRFVVFPIFMFLHFIFTVSFLTNIFLTNSLRIFIVNAFLLLIVAMLNMKFKGCIAHKYEKKMLKEYVTLITFFELFFIPYSVMFNKPLTIKEKVKFVYVFYFIIFVITCTRFLSLLSNQNKKNVL